MRSFKRVALSALCFLCVTALVTFALLRRTDAEGSADLAQRDALAGQVDFLILGSSHAKNGLVPEILDAELGCVSYNLSGLGIPMYGRIELAKEELARNPVRTVVVEIAYDSLSRDNSADFCEGDEALLPRLGSLGARLRYMRAHLSLGDCVNLWSRALYRGAESWFMALTGGHVDEEERGYQKKEPVDMTIAPGKVASLHHRDTMDIGTYRQENIDDLTALIALCREAGAQVLVVTLPVSANFLWATDRLDDFSAWMEAYCAGQEVPYWNFDLLRDRYELFSDGGSFHDHTHLADEAAREFTGVFAQTLRLAAAGEDTGDLFFESYEEAEQGSPYLPLLAEEAG